MSRMLFAAAMFTVLQPALARDYTQEIERALRSCKIERSSMLNDRRGASRCQELYALIELQRLHVEATVALETGQPMPGRDAGISQTGVPLYGGRLVKSPRLAPTRVYDAGTGRWCWIFLNGATMKCD